MNGEPDGGWFGLGKPEGSLNFLRSFSCTSCTYDTRREAEHSVCIFGAPDELLPSGVVTVTSILPACVAAASGNGWWSVWKRVSGEEQLGLEAPEGAADELRRSLGCSLEEQSLAAFDAP
jgi:hypothetical protein